MENFNSMTHEERMRSIVDHVIDGIVTIDARGTIATFNRAAERIFGYPSREVIGQNVKMLMPEPDGSSHDEYIKNYLRTGHKKIIGIGREVLGRRKDGTTFPMGLAVSEFRAGEHRYFTGIVRDISDRKNAEERLRRSEERLRHALQAAHMGAWEFDLDTRENYWGEGMAALLGIAPEEAAEASKRWIDLIHPEDRQWVARAFRAACEERSPSWNRDFRVVRTDGETRWLNSRGTVISSSGKQRVMIGVAQDITDQKRLEAELHETQQRLNETLATARMAYWDWNTITHELTKSPSMSSVFGLAPGQEFVTSEQFFMLLLPEDRERHQPIVQAAWARGEGWHDEFRIIRPCDGEVAWLEERATARRNPETGALHLSGLLWDITERKRAEESLRELTRRLTYHVDHSPLAVIEWGSDMRLTRWSEAAERVFGWSAEEVIGKRMEDFRWIYDEDQGQVAEVADDLTSGRNPNRFCLNRNYRKDGSVVWCEWYNSSLIDESGKLRSILSLVLDVTEGKRAEDALARANEQLSAADRRKDEFLAMLAHELRNPLGVVLNSCEALRRAFDNPSASQFVERIERQVKAARTIIEDLLDLERVRLGRLTITPMRTDLRMCVREAADRFEEAMASRKNGTNVILPPEPVEAYIDPGRCVQIVCNLIDNAIKYAGTEAQITVNVAITQEEACIEVRDDGGGIEREMVAALLDRRDRAGKAVKGLGIGLPLCDQLAKVQGGRLDLRSGDSAGRGLAVIVSFPRAAPFGELRASQPGLFPVS